MLHPIKTVVAGREAVVSCTHAHDWPPAWALSKEPAIEVRRQGWFTDEQYERARTWERVCGLLKMDPQKCLTCPLALGPEGKAFVERPAKIPFRLQRPSIKRGR